MTYTILFFGYRKLGITPEQFRTDYEAHMSMVKEITGEHFPLRHIRRYIHRTKGKAEGTERNANHPATILVGTQADFDYDTIAEMTFADVDAFQAFVGATRQPENAARIAADEERFLDRSTMMLAVFGETTVTTK